MTQLAWQTGHLVLFQRYGGVPLWVRHDNLKTAVARGAGSAGVVNPAFARFALTCGFGLDPCRPGTGSDKGKVERGVRTERSSFADLLLRRWASEVELQGALDARAAELQQRRRCPATGTTVAEALQVERPLLQPVPAVHEPFDVVVARRVSRDCLVSFESRRYSVPFAWVDRLVEVRGTARQGRRVWCWRVRSCVGGLSGRVGGVVSGGFIGTVIGVHIPVLGWAAAAGAAVGGGAQGAAVGAHLGGIFGAKMGAAGRAVLGFIVGLGVCAGNALTGRA